MSVWFDQLQRRELEEPPVDINKSVYKLPPYVLLGYRILLDAEASLCPTHVCQLVSQLVAIISS